MAVVQKGAFGLCRLGAALGGANMLCRRLGTLVEAVASRTFGELPATGLGRAADFKIRFGRRWRASDSLADAESSGAESKRAAWLPCARHGCMRPTTGPARS